MKHVIIGHLCFIIASLEQEWYWWALGCAWLTIGAILIIRGGK